MVFSSNTNEDSTGCPWPWIHFSSPRVVVSGYDVFPQPALAACSFDPRLALSLPDVRVSRIQGLGAARQRYKQVPTVQLTLLVCKAKVARAISCGRLDKGVVGLDEQTNEISCAAGASYLNAWRGKRVRVSAWVRLERPLGKEVAATHKEWRSHVDEAEPDNRGRYCVRQGR